MLVGFLDWLKVDGDDGLRHATATPGTGQWLLQSQEFRSRMESGHNSIFWISGRPGSGKTVLSKFLFEQSKNTTIDISRNTALYFSFDWAQNIASKTAGVILRSFIFQILSQVPSSMSDFIPFSSQQHDCYTKVDTFCRS